MKKHKLLIVNNNYHSFESLHSLIRYYPEFDLVTLDKPDIALKDVTENIYDIIFLDFSLLSINCIDICNHIRASKLNKESYIIVLSNESDQNKQVSIFQSAQFDDFIYKTSFTNQMFITKVKAITRREERLYNEKNIILKKKNYEYFLNNELINLTQTEFDILLILDSNSNNYYSSCHISNLLNNKNYTSSTVRVHIKNIRNKFIKITNSELILTIPKKGYKLNCLSIIN